MFQTTNQSSLTRIIVDFPWSSMVISSKNTYLTPAKAFLNRSTVGPGLVNGKQKGRKESTTHFWMQKGCVWKWEIPIELIQIATLEGKKR